MKEGAIIHRLRCYRALRGITLPLSCETTVGYWILAGSNHRALPCAVPATHMKEGDEK